MPLTVMELVATLGLDDRPLDRDLNRGLSQAESRVSKTGTAIKAALTAGLAGGLLAIGHTGYEEVMDAAKGQAQLEAGIKSTGGAAGVTEQQMEDLASAIQDYSGQTDDSIVQTESLLLTFTNIKNVGADKIFDDATKAAADMAAKLGGDASASAIQLGKALNDPIKGVTALSRVGVSFTEQQKAQITTMVNGNNVLGAQKVILAELNKEFGGAAKAAGESLPGQLARAKRAFEDASQEVMTGMTPALKDVAWLIRELAPEIPALTIAFGSLWAAVKGYTVLKQAGSMLKDFQNLAENVAGRLGMGTGSGAAKATGAGGNAGFMEAVAANTQATIANTEALLKGAVTGGGSPVGAVGETGKVAGDAERGAGQISTVEKTMGWAKSAAAMAIPITVGWSLADLVYSSGSPTSKASLKAAREVVQANNLGGRAGLQPGMTRPTLKEMQSINAPFAKEQLSAQKENTTKVTAAQHDAATKITAAIHDLHGDLQRVLKSGELSRSQLAGLKRDLAKIDIGGY